MYRSTDPASNSTRALAALLVLSIVWGYNWVVMKEALRYIGPFQFGALRTFLGGLVLLLVLLMLRKPWRPQHLAQIARIGVLQTGGFTALIVYALVAGGAGKVAVLTYTMPFWVMLMAWPMLGEKLHGLQWLAALASVAGMLCIVEPWHMHGSLLSSILAVLAGVCWALAVILAKRLHQEEPGLDLLSFTGWQMLIGSLPLVVLALYVPAAPIQWSNYLIGSAFYNVIVCNALAWLLWLYALQHLPAGIASMVSLLTPVVGVLAAWLQLGEAPTALEMAGMLLIGAALAVLALRGMRRREAIEPAMAQE